MATVIQQYLQQDRIANTNSYVLSVKKLKTLDIQRWSGNRPPDPLRVEEIKQQIKTSGIVDGILHIAHIQHVGLRCHDGNHRLTALLSLTPEYDTLVVILTINLFDATEEQVKEEFLRLNKSVSVPTLYSEEENSHTRKEIEKICDFLCKTYPTHVSPSGKCMRPNFNRDKFIDECSRILQETSIPIETLQTRIISLNNQYSARDHTTLPEKVRSKCEKSGLWLFAWSPIFVNADFVAR